MTESSRPNAPRRLGNPGAASVMLMVMLMLLGGLTGCRRLPEPEVRFAAPGIFEPFKRYERNAERDFIHHFLRTAYSASRVKGFDPASDQAIILGEWGAPDYAREFTSFQGEEVLEWVYFDDQAIFQFIGDGLVFDGTLTDHELLLLQYGYPDVMVIEINEAGNVHHAFYYDSIFWPDRMDVFKLTNDWIVFKSLGA